MRIRARLLSRQAATGGVLAPFPFGSNLRHAGEKPTRGSWEWCLTFVNFFVVPRRTLFAWLVVAGSTCPAIGAAASLHEITKQSGPVRTLDIRLNHMDVQHQYSLLYSISALDSLGPDARVTVEIAQGEVILGAKTLHAGDADFYTQFRVPQNGEAGIRVRTIEARGVYRLQVNQWPLTEQVASGPNHDWQHAMSIPVGKTIFASGDDAEYTPLPGVARRLVAEDRNGEDWYRFEFREKTPKLVFFQIELMDRDQLPVNVRVYRLSGGRLTEYFEGEDPVTLPHEVQAL